MFNRIIEMIKMAYVSLVDGDSSDYPRVQASYGNKVARVVRLSPYGLCSNPPKNAFILLLSNQAQESNKFGISSSMINRLKPLAEGEVVLFNEITGDYVYLKANGDMKVVCTKDLDATVGGDAALNVTGDANVTAGGTLTLSSTGDMTLSAPNIKLSGNLTMDGNMSGAGGGKVKMPNDAEISGITFNNPPHKHTGVQTGGGTSGGPTN